MPWSSVDLEVGWVSGDLLLTGLQLSVLTLPLSLSLAGLPAVEGAPWLPGPREAIAWAASLGARAVQLDATGPTMRPRELDRSGRRDVAALLRRHALQFSGLDLWIPTSHFADPAHVDRAASAVHAAAELAADLAVLTSCPGAVVVSFALDGKVGDDLVSGLRSAAERVGASLADHAWPLRKSTTPSASLPVGIDPATILLASADPVLEVTRLSASPASVRLSDASEMGRVDPREGGRLDARAFAGVVATRGYTRPFVIDLRGLRDPERTAKHWLTLAGT